MNKRNFFLVLLGAVVAAIAVFWWLRSSPLPAAPQASMMAKQSAATPTSTPSSIAQAPPAGRQILAGTIEASDARWKERELKRRIDPQYEWKMPINFFGRVVDEKGQPVPRATIVAQWSDLSPRGATDETFLSDDQGFFSMTEKTG